MDIATSDRVYCNSGNPRVVGLVTLGPSVKVLDVGCGAGDNAALLKSSEPRCEIYGITASAAEAALARRHMVACWIADLEAGLPAGIRGHQFDTIIFSHVLEHLRDPMNVVRTFVAHLREGGECIIAVPNIMCWRERLKFVAGRFEYQETGTMDETHLRFFSYETAPRYLLGSTPELVVVERQVSGSVPLWILRRWILPKYVADAIDALGCKWRPNLFGSEVILRATKELCQNALSPHANLWASQGGSGSASSL